MFKPWRLISGAVAWLHSFLISTLVSIEWSPTPGKQQLPAKREADWATEPVATFGEKNNLPLPKREHQTFQPVEYFLYYCSVFCKHTWI